ncbi:MAG TPA: MBOAT family protein, partial [Polyangiaceae bacterium]
MQFTTLAYAKFFALAFVVTWLFSRARRVRLLFLLAASYFFYAQSGVRFLALIWACSTADFLLSHAIGRASEPHARKRWLALTVVMNLGVLAFFKYLRFGVDNAQAALDALGIHLPPIALAITLPVGISFFTFESMSYVIDVYRGDIEPHQSYLEYLTFVA